MEKELIVRPRLIRQSREFADSCDTEADYNAEAAKKSMISKRNTSRFFSHLYVRLFGGEIVEDPWGNGLSDKTKHSFNPDIARKEDGRRAYTEVKSTSGRSLQIHSSIVQVSRNLARILRSSEKDENPDYIEYAFFKYGNRNLTGQYRLGNRGLVKTLIDSEKSLVIVPFNLMLFLASSSRLSTRDQSSSQHSQDVGGYFVIRGSTLNGLLKGNPILNNNGKNHLLLPSELENLFLGDIEMRQFMAPEIHVRYFNDFVVESFPVTKYSLSDKNYSAWLRDLQDNYQEIISSLGLEDLHTVPF